MVLSDVSVRVEHYDDHGRPVNLAVTLGVLMFVSQTFDGYAHCGQIVDNVRGSCG